MNTPFSLAADGGLSQPIAATPLVLRSSSASDDVGVQITSRLSGTATTANVRVQGRREVVTSSSVNEVISLLLWDGATFTSHPASLGVISVLQAGTSAHGTITVNSLPAQDNTLTLSLAGGVGSEVYTFTQPGWGTFTCGSGGSISTNDEVRVALNGSTTVRFIFGVNGVNPSTATSSTVAWVAILSTDANTAVASKLQAAMAAQTTFAAACVATVTSNVVQATQVAIATGFNVTINVGTGVTASLGYAGHSATNAIRIGYDTAGAAISTTAAIATNIAAALTANSTLLSAAAIGSAVNLSDKVACNRQLAWALATTATSGTLTIAQPIGGVDGALVAQLFPGTLSSSEGVSFDQFALGVTSTLPGLMTPVSDWVSVGGATCNLWVSCNTVSSGITAKYQTTIDPAHSEASARDGETSISTLNNNTQRISIPEKCEAIRFVVTANTNTAATLLDARVLY